MSGLLVYIGLGFMILGQFKTGFGLIVAGFVISWLTPKK